MQHMDTHYYGREKTGAVRFVRITCAFILIFLPCLFLQSQANCKSHYNRNVIHYPYLLDELTVIGDPKSYTVAPEDTFLDISRKYELGFNEMAILYPQTDPWMPPAGKNIKIPCFWVLPPESKGQLVINIPEMRLYFFEKDASCVQTYPVSIGRIGWETPTGNFSITEKRNHPTWYVPKSLQKKYGTAIMPPGPENPLGNYIMRFSVGSYSMHGTNMPWGVGRLVSHGCIRCYPEHIRLIYPEVALKTRVAIIYEPIKFGKKHDRIFVEVHPDVYNRISDFRQYAAKKLNACPMTGNIDLSQYEQAVRLKNGMPMDVTRSSKNINPEIRNNKSNPGGCPKIAIFSKIEEWPEK